MGAESSAYIVSGKTAEVAYRTARDEAVWEHGHGGYTGSVAESSGFKQARPRTRYEAEKAADRLLRGETVDGLTARKWEYAVMIPIVPDRETRTAILPVDLTGLDERADDWQQDSLWLLAARAVAGAERREGEHIMRLKLTTKAHSGEYLAKYGTDDQKKVASIIRWVTKPKVRRTEGERITEYAVVLKDGHRTNVLEVFPTLEAAKDGAVATASNLHGATVGIIQQVRRDGGSGFLYDVGIDTTKRIGAVTVTYGERADGPPAAGAEFLMVGVYSC